MAKQPGYQARSTQGGKSELKNRLLFVLGALIVFRIGSFIPVPGIDAAVLAQLIEPANAGYGTAKHLEGLEKLGVTPIHRTSFEPVKTLVSTKKDK